MGFFENISINNKISKLKRYKNDLNDDYSAVSTYNDLIDAIISDYQDFVKTGYSGVTNKLENYKEPYQYNDSKLTNATSYIQREINYWENQKDKD